MWALRDADLRKPRAAMPAAMLPCPSPAGPDWSFQNPVGVDCSSPEPRCIWLAVLRGATSSVQRATPPAMPAEHGQKRLHPGVRRGPPLGAVRVALSLQLKENRNTIFNFFFFCGAIAGKRFFRFIHCLAFLFQKMFTSYSSVCRPTHRLNGAIARWTEG